MSSDRLKWDIPTRACIYVYENERCFRSSTSKEKTLQCEKRYIFKSAFLRSPGHRQCHIMKFRGRKKLATPDGTAEQMPQIS